MAQDSFQKLQESVNRNDHISLLKLRIQKEISVAYPMLDYEFLERLMNFENLGNFLFVDPYTLQNIFDFSYNIAPYLESSLELVQTPYVGYNDYIAEKDNNIMNIKIQEYTLENNLRKNEFIPKSFDNVTGWTIEEVNLVIENIKQVMSEQLQRPPEDFTFNEIIEYTFNNYSPDTDEYMAVKIFTDVILIEINAKLRQRYKDLISVLYSLLTQQQLIIIGLRLAFALDINANLAMETIREVAFYKRLSKLHRKENKVTQSI